MASKKHIFEIFNIDIPIISRHIKFFFKDNELNPTVVHAKFAQATAYGALKGKTLSTGIEIF